MVVHSLGLFDGNFRKTITGQPTIADFQIWTACMIHPLVEEAIKGSSRQTFKAFPKVIGNDTLQFIAGNVITNALPVEIRTQLRAKHVQNPTAFWISTKVELLLRILVTLKDDRAFILTAWQYTPFCIVIQPVKHRIVAIFMALIEMGVISSKAFVKPKLTPILTSQQITEPLMS